MEKNYVVVSKATGLNGYVVGIKSNKIYVDFCNSPENSIGLSIKEFMELLIIDENDLLEIERELNKKNTLIKKKKK